jgi:hypothetical protein
MRSRQASTAARWAAVPDGPGTSAETRARPGADGAASRAPNRDSASRSAAARAGVHSASNHQRPPASQRTTWS